MGILDLVLQSSSSVSLLGTLVVLLLVYLLSSSSFSSQEDRKGPPGPKPLPFIGNLLQLDLKRPYSTLVKFSKKYGSVFTVYLGPQKVVVLAGYKTVKEALVNRADEFGERHAMQITHDYNLGHGVLWSNGDSWKEMRRFALTNLRDFGMGKRASEDKIIEECEHLIEVSTLMMLIFFPVSFIAGEVLFHFFLSLRLWYNLFPWLGKWIPNKQEMHSLIVANKKQNLRLFSRLKETLNPQMCRGFVDSFLVKKQNLEESGNTNSHFHNENLLVTVLNLFAAGTDTTATTLRWGLLFMAKYPKIQGKEINRVIGSRQAQVEDRKNLPYTDAVIHETQRMGNIVPMSLPHQTSQDVTFQGHFIEKGTTVIPLLTSVLSDESEWEEPHSFHPAHFLDKDGKFLKRDAFMPFSAGRRACLGESLAKMELFIFFTTLMQQFRFTAPPGVSEEELDLTPCVSFTRIHMPRHVFDKWVSKEK
uniref:Cytochrome P450 2K1-like n=1 Tax=Cyclopterus lumpus TaxID=8103 RepID=A0A8C3G0K7_CYCLU